MSDNRRETPEERAERDRREHIELLKMKQGLIEESEYIPETGYEKIPELHGWAKFKNNVYHNKWFILMGAFAAMIAAVLIVQIASREKYDIRVLAVANDPDSEMVMHANKFEKALERYCPDFDGNGKVHVELIYINRTSGDVTTRLDQADAQKLSAELQTAEAQFIISDDQYTKWTGKDNDPTEVFLDQTGSCAENMLVDSVGVRLNKTGFAKEARWSDCPDNVIFLVRGELNNGSGSVKKNAENRERAQTVLQNIIDGNVVNPDDE